MSSDPPTAETGLPEVARLRLDLALRPVDVLRALRHRPRLVALVGAWHQGEALVAMQPTLELGVDDDPFDLGVSIGPADGPVDGPADGTVGGGWIGLWGHRLRHRVERLPEPHRRPVPQRDHVVGWYDHVLRLVDGTWWAEGLAGPEALRDWLDDLLPDLLPGLTGPAEVRPHVLGELTPTPGPNGHRDAVASVVEHVHAGDIFQANLCMRLDGDLEGDPLDVFCAGVEALAPAYAAYVSWDGGAVVSFSPELFLRRTGREVLTSPIKGTAPLDADPAELAASAKDRAENVMIVDLMRNDLGRVCTPGSVRVPAMVRVERHAVWHLVSDVVGHLRPGLDDGDLLRATFPPGSVTGAPKVRALEIVTALEATGREAYTGAIGHVGPRAGLELNVVIRTFEFARTGPDRWRAWLGVGGGVVADSTPEGEHAECVVKARPLVEAVGGRLGAWAAPTEPAPPVPTRPESTARVTARRAPAGGVFETVLVLDGRPVDLDQHLARLDASVRALYDTTVRAGLESAVARKVRGLSGTHRLRIDAVPRSVDLGGDVDVSMVVAPVTPEPGPWRLDVRVVPGGWGAHKWVDREALGPHLPGRDLLLVDDDGSVLETARASVFVVRDDGVHTPPLDGRILPGTMRARVVDALAADGIPVYQHRLTTADLTTASEVFVTNALRGVVPVSEVAGVGTWPAGPFAARWAVGPPPSEHAHGGTVTVPGQEDRRDGRPRVLFVDNYDSFVYNLVQYVGELGGQATVVRNDAADVGELVALRESGDITHLVISPGPGTPAEAGISAELVRRLGPTTPTLGVCLGHQVIAEVYGGRVERASEVVHGKPSLVHHDGRGVLAGLPSPLTCARYHSLVAVEASLPPVLEVTARTASGVVMGLRHRSHPVEGVQMHPESILTHRGHDMLENFLWT